MVEQQLAKHQSREGERCEWAKGDGGGVIKQSCTHRGGNWSGFIEIGQEHGELVRVKLGHIRGAERCHNLIV